MRRRDEDEFTEFAAITVRRLRRTAYLMCGDWHRAEDAAQDALAPGQHACVVLRHYADFSVEQTADVLGIGTGAVKARHPEASRICATSSA